MIDELYILDKLEGIKKDGHLISLGDVVKDLNEWRNQARDMRNKNALLLKEIGKLKYGSPKGCGKVWKNMYQDEICGIDSFLCERCKKLEGEAP